MELEELRLGGQDVAVELVLFEARGRVEVEDGDVVHRVALGVVKQLHGDLVDPKLAHLGNVGEGPTEGYSSEWHSSEWYSQQRTFGDLEMIAR